MNKPLDDRSFRVFLCGSLVACLSFAGMAHLEAQQGAPRATWSHAAAKQDQAAAQHQGALPSAANDTGLFISPRPEFPFALQIESFGDRIIVTGLGRMPYSADVAEQIAIEFRAMGLKSSQAGLRGLIRAVADGDKLQQDQFIPWVALYDPDNGSWDFMFSPQHVLSASRPGAAAKRAPNKPVRTGNADVDRIGEQLFALTDIAAAAGPEGIELAMNASRLQSQAQSVVSTLQSRLQPLYQQMVAGLTGFATRMASGISSARGGNSQTNTAPATRRGVDQATYDNYLIIWNAVGAAIAQASNPSSNGANSSGGPIVGDNDLDRHLGNISRLIQRSGGNQQNSGSSGSARPGSRNTASATSAAGSAAPTTSQSRATPANSSPPVATDPWKGRHLDEFLADFWAAGFDHSRLVVIPREAPDPDHAWEIQRVTVLPDGRVEIVFNGSGPFSDGANADSRVAGNQRIRPGVRQPDGSRSGGTGVAGGGPGTSTQPDGSGGSSGTNPADGGGSQGGDPNSSSSQHPGVPSNPTDVQPPPRMPDPPPPPPSTDDLRPLAGEGISREPIGSRQVLVPNLVGLDLQSAYLELRSAKLEVGLKPVSTAQGAVPKTVLSQSPSAGTSVPTGTTIMITYYEEPKQNDEYTELIGEDSNKDPRNDRKPAVVEQPRDMASEINEARRRFNEAAGPYARAKGPESDAGSSGSSLTPDQMAAARDALQRHRAPSASDAQPDSASSGSSLTPDQMAAASDALQRHRAPSASNAQPDSATVGFQQGDLASVDPRFADGEKIDFEHRAIHWQRTMDHHSESFSISSLEIPAVAEHFRRWRAAWEAIDPAGWNDTEIADNTVKEFSVAEDRGIVDWYGVALNPITHDFTQFMTYHVYRGHLITYSNMYDRRAVPDAGENWPRYLRAAQALIDRRFPANNAPPKQTGFQPGDAAKLGSGLTADEGIEPNRKLWIRGSDPNRPQRNFLIASLDDPMGSETLKARQQEWNSARSWYENRERNGQARYDIRDLHANEQEGAMDITVSGQLNGDPDYSSFARYEVYRNFIIYYADSTHGQGRSDRQLSQGWSQFAASARQLIDQRFPE